MDNWQLTIGNDNDNDNDLYYNDNYHCKKVVELSGYADACQQLQYQLGDANQQNAQMAEEIKALKTAALRAANLSTQVHTYSIVKGVSH